jgi:hypothetical protein
MNNNTSKANKMIKTINKYKWKKNIKYHCVVIKAWRHLTLAAGDLQSRERFCWTF